MSPEQPNPLPQTVVADPARRRWLRAAAGGGLLITLGAPHLAWGAAIVAVRVWPAKDYTRVTLESDEPLAGKHFVTDNPPRLVVDIDGLQLNSALNQLSAKVKSSDPHISRVRIGQDKVGTVRVVFDLKSMSRPQVFALAPVAPYKHRLVFDVYPLEPDDPLLALLKEREAAEAAPPLADAGDTAAPPPSPAIDPEVTPPKVAAKPPAGSPEAEKPPRVASTGKPPAAPLETDTPQGRLQRLLIVAIDPGHGGEDPGAIGPSGLREKDVVLAIAKQLAERINAKPGMRAMLTRDDDYFVPLAERVAKARKVQADLFVSIHADAFIKPTAAGASVFALSDGGATSTMARWMAKRENSSDAIGGINIAAHDTHVLRALLDMSTTAQIRDSLKLGAEVLGHIGKVGRLHAGKVEQAGFAVLKAPDIPSILVETAFISNPDEERKLRDNEYQDRLVKALYTGINRYFSRNPPMQRNRMV
jgi:N-acetylmuramoyl-L-alanine amidase